MQPFLFAIIHSILQKNNFYAPHIRYKKGLQAAIIK